ncbi:glycoside hydrolase superfamily [Hypoxylon crocopeplum]|nr:glycoside hydrolase superfamily [Hypoxylon crocopeplum]
MQIPHLVRVRTTKQLVVHGKPFLMLPAELQNSSLTCAEYMDSVWEEMKDTNVNTLLGCVTWEMIEPVEGQFDFSELDKVILGARNHGLHLILLWFGSFKNGLSTYVPSWVKTNPQRFPRAKLRKAGGVVATADVLSVFHPEGKHSDMIAFSKLMTHLKEFDESYSTVLMVQVENETGLLGDSRDACAIANQRFAEAVPKDLIHFLEDEWDSLDPDIRAILGYERNAGPPTYPEGNWEEVFGKGPRTDELFMAYHYALYLNEVAAAGKSAYPIPMYTNTWMNYAGENSDNTFPIVAGGGGMPGDYPSGGPVSNVLDIWQKFAPNLDFISPDIYLNDYESLCVKYRHRNQPLFIPEQKRDDYGARRIWIAYGSYAALGASPFGIDTVKPKHNPFTKHFGLLSSVSALVLEAQRNPGSSVGFCFDELPDGAVVNPAKPVIRRWGDFEIIIEPCFVFGKRDAGAGMVIHRGGGRFLLIGWGFQVRAKSLYPKATFTGILRFEEKVVVDRETGELKTQRWLNGDETRSGKFAMMPSENPDYGGFPICVTIPARTMIAELEVYSLEEDDG